MRPPEVAYARASKRVLDRLRKLPCADAARTDTLLPHLLAREAACWRNLPKAARAAILDPNRREG